MIISSATSVCASRLAPICNHLKTHNEILNYKDQIEFDSDEALRPDMFRVYSLPGMEDITSKYS